jgi:Zn-dependent peptidase ImmA (M78 family)/transcriptional regulator with XRE-family HTH domain
MRREVSLVKHADKTIGATIQNLRKQHGLSQKQLAVRLGVKHAQVISALESGERALKATELARLAGILRVQPSAILAAQARQAAPKVLWRGEDNLTAHSDEEALFVARCKRYAFLEEVGGGRKRAAVPAFALDLETTRFEDVECWAETVRGGLRLGATPALSLRDALETEWGIKVFFTPLLGGSAATVRAEFGDAIMISANEPPWRRHYSLAHELFHLLTWGALLESVSSLTATQRKRNETLAEVFASALLLPAEALEARLPRLREGEQRWFGLFALAREFGVSTKALLWRLVNLGLIPATMAEEFNSNARLAVLDQSLRDWGKEPGSQLPARFVYLAFGAYVQQKISIGKLAELMETTVGLLPRELAAFDLDLNSDAYQATFVPA